MFNNVPTSRWKMLRSFCQFRGRGNFHKLPFSFILGIPSINANSLNCNNFQNLCQWVKVQTVIDPGATRLFSFYKQTINTCNISNVFDFYKSFLDKCLNCNYKVCLVHFKLNWNNWKKITQLSRFTTVNKTISYLFIFPIRPNFVDM